MIKDPLVPLKLPGSGSGSFDASSGGGLLCSTGATGAVATAGIDGTVSVPGDGSLGVVFILGPLDSVMGDSVDGDSSAVAPSVVVVVVVVNPAVSAALLA